MRKTICEICRIWDPEWDGMVIAEITYRQKKKGQEEKWTSRVRGGKLVRIECTEQGSGNIFRLILVRPSAQEIEIRPRKEEIRNADWVLWKSFSKDDIHAYSAAVGDHNSIHQGGRPMADGLCLFEELWKTVPDRTVYRMRFCCPVWADVPVYLERTECGVRGFSGNILCFEMNWENAVL